MADETATPDAADFLPASLLADTAADTRRQWSARGLCTDKDPEIFFPLGDGAAAEAKAICGSCPVRRQCLAYAITADEQFGIWGSLGPQERHNLRRRLQRRGVRGAELAAGSAA
jgi:WhiB family transcriptional regulator, redox-sensing transcriptional regulator